VKSYDFPDYEGLSPEAARKALGKFRADVIADRDHPFSDPQHYEHAAAVKCFDSLNEMIRAGEADTQADATAQELEDALGDEKPCRTRAEALARVAALLRTPGYVTHERGEPVLTDGERGRIRKKVHALSMLVERGDAEGQRIAAEERIAAKQAADGDADADAGDDDDGGWAD